MKNRMLPLWTAPFLLMVQLLLLASTPASWAASGTKILDIRMGIYADHTRLVFDAAGDRPLGKPTLSDGGVTIDFAKFQAGYTSGKTYKHPSAAIAGVSFQEGDSGSRIYVSFRSPNTTVKHEFIPSKPPRHGRYRLVIDFYPEQPIDAQTSLIDSSTDNDKHNQLKPDERKESKSKKEAKAGSVDEKAEIQSTRKGTEESSQNSNQTPKSKRPAEKPTNGKASAPIQASAEPTVPDSEVARVLYEKADEFFQSHSRMEDKDAQQILEYYQNALKAAPKSTQAPLALYRCGLAFVSLGNLKKAESYFHQAITFGPANALFSQCWLKLGEIFHQKRSYIEAVEAFRFALRYPLEPTEKAQAHYFLGRELSIIGVHKEAVENLDQCLKTDPNFYLKIPDLFKFRGESHFTTRQFSASRDDLLRYLNLVQDAQDRDLILAKLAEVMLHEGDQDLATLLYAYIETNYEDSEGDIICKIRNAEMLESQGQGDRDSAHAVYLELAKKNVLPPLRRLVTYKLATWEWRHGNYSAAMGYIEEILRGKSDATSQGEFLSLKEKVIVEWVQKAQSEKDYVQIVQLYEKHPSSFRSLQSPELEATVGDSYAMLGLHSSAAAIYERLVSSSKKKDEAWIAKAAYSQLHLCDLEKASQFCRQIQSDALDAKKTDIQGRIAFQQKKYAEAVKHFGKIFTKEKDPPPVEFESVRSYAESLMGLSKYDEAILVLQNSYDRLRQEDAEQKLQVSLLLSKCFQELKQPQKAIEALEKALAQAASDDLKSQLSYEISKLYVALGKPDMASRRLSQILGTSQAFWKTAAQQQLDSIQMLPKK